MTSPKIVVIGSLNTDLVATVDRIPEAGETLKGRDFNVYCGGKGANQAYAAGHLGGDVAMVGQVGTDNFGTTQIQNLSSVGINTDFIQRDPTRPTGTALIAVEASGENRIILVSGANETFTANRLIPCEELLQRAKIILLQLEIPRETVGEAIRIGTVGSACIILDPAPAGPIPDAWFAGIDFLTPNLSELCILTGDRLGSVTPLEQIAQSARKLCARGIRCVIAKLGPRGALRITPDEIHHWPAIPVQAVDTTAAGDCFNAAFAVELAAGRTELEAGEFAVAAASYSVTKNGAQAAMPTRSDIRDFRK